MADITIFDTISYEVSVSPDSQKEIYDYEDHIVGTGDNDNIINYWTILLAALFMIGGAPRIRSSFTNKVKAPQKSPFTGDCHQVRQV
jgi:hypothetical protein